MLRETYGLKKVRRTVLVVLLASIGPMHITISATPSARVWTLVNPSSVYEISVAQNETPAQQLKFQVEYSELLAVYVFVSNLSSKVPDNPFKKLFNSSKFNDEKYKNLIADFDKLTLDYTIEYPEYRYTDKNTGSTESLLKRNLINSGTIDQFQINSLGIIPAESLLKLSSTLREFQPVYQELVYLPNKEKFESQLGELKKLMGSTDMAAYFEVGLKFYNSSWDKSIPIHFVFYPLLNSRGYTATAYSNNAESGIPTSLTEYNGLLSVIFHEIFHILYDEESLTFKKELERWRSANPSRSSHYAFALLNEALATTLGNGYVYAKLNGKENDGPWYGRPKYISMMAKKIYPLAKEYIEKQRPIDKAFLDSYVRIFDENFSDWLLDLDYVMSGRYVLTDNPNDFDVIDRKFPYRPLTQYEVVISERSIDKMGQAPPVTRVVLVSKDNKRKLQLIKTSFPELKDWKPNAKTDFEYSLLLNDKTYLIVLNSVKAPVAKQIEMLKLK